MPRTCLLLAILACTAATPTTPSAPIAPRSPAAAAAPQAPFEFHVAFWVNLHQRLYEESGAHPRAGALALTASADRDAWNNAVAFYRARYPTRSFLTLLEDPELVKVNRELARAEDARDLGAVKLPSEVRTVLEAVAPVYRTHGWPEDRAAGVRFEQRLGTLLDRHGSALVSTLARAYQTPWPSPSVRVDIAAYAGPVAAYTVLDPALTTIANGDARHAGDAALEILFHEASHALVDRVEHSIERACAAQHRPEPPQLWHEVLFWGTGELVRRELGAGYKPYGYANDLYARNPTWTAAEPLIARYWRDYLDGARSLDAAIDAIVGGLPQS
jgi:hypothetical protein